MEKHAPEECPRCNSIFSCKVNTIHQCDCMKMELTFAETQYVRDLTTSLYDGGCLCLKCLQELKEEFQNNQTIKYASI
jgi:Cysteine-rich CWC